MCVCVCVRARVEGGIQGVYATCLSDLVHQVHVSSLFLYSTHMQPKHCKELRPKARVAAAAGPPTHFPGGGSFLFTPSYTSRRESRLLRLKEGKLWRWEEGCGPIAEGSWYMPGSVPCVPSCVRMCCGDVNTLSPCGMQRMAAGCGVASSVCGTEINVKPLCWYGGQRPHPCTCCRMLQFDKSPKHVSKGLSASTSCSHSTHLSACEQGS